MSKETKASHRKINVDAFEEGIYVEDDSIADNSAAAVEQKSSAVKAFLRGGQSEKALNAAIADTPYKANKEVKDKNVKVVADVLGSYRAADISSAVTGLSEADRDTLLKLVYRAMEFPAETNSASLLSWHKAIVDVAGEGAIARVISDRQRV